MISKEDVEGLAELARLELSEQEKAALQKDISSILEYVEMVSTIEIPQSEAARDTAAPMLRNAMRGDVPAGEGGVAVLATREALVEAFPKKEAAPVGGFFNVVRKIIQKDE